MRWMILVGALALVGCATPGQMAVREANLSYTTTKSAAELEECLSLAMEWSPDAVSGKGKRILDYKAADTTIFTVTIYEASPTLAEMRWGGPVLAQKWRNRFRQCA